MAPREQFQILLEGICERVYFQPPGDMSLVYPCIVYERDRGDTKFANNRPYKFEQQYEVTLISTDPDEDAIFTKLRDLPKSIHARFFVTDNLNHNVFSIYF